VAILFTLLFTAPALAAPPQTDWDRRVEELTGYFDPAADDWTTEQLNTRAGARLAKLAGILARLAAAEPPERDEELSDLFTPDAQLAALRPPEGQTQDVPPFRIRRVEPLTPASRVESSAPPPAATNHADPLRALTTLVEPHRGCADFRAYFKVVGVTSPVAADLRVGRPSPDQHFDTTALFQAFGGGVQQNAVWQIRWRLPDLTADPRIARIDIQHYTEARVAAPPFADATGSVIRDKEAWEPFPARGSDYWYGRIDAVGELNFMGHEGIAVGDVNGDGLDDVYVAAGTGLPNRLYVQQPDGTVRDTAREAGVDWLDDTKGVLFVDLDNDGDEDLLCAIGPTIVYCQNDGTGKFTPHRALRAATPAAFYSLAAADYDLDGDLDIYGCRYVKVAYGISVPLPLQDAENGPPNHLLRNDGEAGFTDVTAQVGLNVNNTRFSTTAAWEDYDNDGDPDLYVANDFGRNNLYRNDGGRFTDVAADAGVEDQAAGMGVSWSDADLDGDFDLYVSNMFSSAGQRIAYQPRFMESDRPDDLLGVRRHSQGDSLLLNRGDGTFADISDSAGVRMGRWAWGAVFVDLNNDACDDLVVPNGFLTNQVKDDL